MRIRPRATLWLPAVCVLLSLAVRLPVRPDPPAAAPWIRGALLLQGIALPEDAGPARQDLVVALPLAIAQNFAAAAVAVGGGRGGLDRVAWIREQASLWRDVLWIFWLLAGAAGSLLAYRIAGRGWRGLVAGLFAALLPVSLGGTWRLEAWVLAAPLALAVLLPLLSGSRALFRPAVGWGALLSLTPLGWILALLAAILGNARLRLALLIAIPIWFALDPARLTDPGSALPAAFASLRPSVWPGIGAGPPARLLVASWTAGPVGLLLVACAWPRARRDRALRILLAWALALWILPAILGARSPEPVGLVAPGTAVLAAVGAAWLGETARRSRAQIAAGAAVLLLAFLAWGSVTTLRSESQRRGRVERMAAIVAREVGRGGRLLVDPSLPPSVFDSVAAFPLPAHAERPEVWDFAWWPGWYGSFTHLLVSARTLETLAGATNRPGGRALLYALPQHADALARVGDLRDRNALLLFRLRSGPPWSPENGTQAWSAIRGGPFEAGFLIDLATFLGRTGDPQTAIELLRLARGWSPQAAGLWAATGSILLQLGDAKGAADAFENGLRRDPSSLELRYGLARAYLDAGIGGRALIELRRLLQEHPEFAPAHFDLARAAGLEEDWALAVEALRAYLERESDPAKRAQAEDALALARSRLAEESLRQSQRAAPPEPAR
ncbi:MAG: tetratricopeptide repeat protein [Candidatus Eisenbacteria bacterium]